MNDEELLKLYRIRLKDRKKIRYKRRDLPEKVSGILEGVFESSGLDSQKLLEGKALVLWEKVVGDQVSKLAQAKKVHEKKLFVKVEDPLWRQELIFAKSQILKKYRELLPRLDLRDIYFQG